MVGITPIRNRPTNPSREARARSPSSSTDRRIPRTRRAKSSPKPVRRTCRALRSNSDVLLTILSIFVKEPNLDWVAMAEKTERKQRKKLEQLNSKRITSLSSLTSGSSTSSIGSTMGTLTQEGVLAEDKLRFYYENRILTVKSKLLGLHPSNIIVEELESSRAILRDSKLAEACRNVVRGLKGSPRAQDKWKQPKSIEEQISFILDLASDKNVLGRTWQGWMPWV